MHVGNGFVAVRDHHRCTTGIVEKVSDPFASASAVTIDSTELQF